MGDQQVMRTTLMVRRIQKELQAGLRTFAGRLLARPKGDFGAFEGTIVGAFGPTFRVPFPGNGSRSRVASKYPQVWPRSLLRTVLRTRIFPSESIKAMVFAASKLRE